MAPPLEKSAAKPPKPTAGGVKYLAGKTVKVGLSHWDPGHEIPVKIAEGLSNLDECLENETIVRIEAGKEKTEPMQLPTLAEWLAAGYGKELSPEAQRGAHTELLVRLREEAKEAGRRIIEPK